MTYEVNDRAQADELRHQIEALRENAAKYRSLFDSIDEGFAILQMILDDSGRVVDFSFLETNPAFERVTGMDLVGKRALSAVPNLERSWIDIYGRVALTREPIRFENYAEATGQWFSVYAMPTGPEGSHQVAIIFTDITERKRTGASSVFLADLSEALISASTPAEVMRALGERAGAYFGASVCTFIQINEAQDEAVITDEWHRSGGTSLLGTYRLATWIVDDFQRTMSAGLPMIVPDVAHDPRILNAAGLAALNVGAGLVVPLIRDGEWRFALAVFHEEPYGWQDGEIALMLETTTRIWNRLERARAEARQRETEARLQQALDASNMGTFVWHIEDNRGESDARMLGLFGLLPGATLNLAQALDTLIHPYDRERYALAIRRASDPEGSGTVREDIRVLHPDGSLHWLAITARTVFEGWPRRAARLVGMAQDISERKFTEDALRRSEERLKEADRRKDEFLATLAHELRNPLAPIRTGLELIRLTGDKPDAISRTRTMMERQVSHMVRLIDDLLDVSRITSGKIRLQRQPTPLATLVNTAIEANRAALEAGKIALGIDLPDAPVILDVDPTRFVQILSNVVHNAIKFTDPGGQIRLWGTLALARSGHVPELSLLVSDTGVGISGEMLPHVFDLFAQGDLDSKRQHAGLGIGLALAQRLISMHGGSIEALSEGPGKGSTFVIRMPISPAPAETALPDFANTPLVPRRVVVIDDNRDAANAMAQLVEALGGDCRVGYDGQSGLQEVLAYRPDVVLLDIGMPGIDGYETCRRIREELGSTVYVIALTGWGQDQDKEQATRAGFDAHLTKPANPVVLERMLADARVMH